MFEKNSDFKTDYIKKSDSMAWHNDPEPPRSKQPLGSNGSKNSKKSGPPNLDEVYAQVKKQVQALWGNKKGTGHGGDSNGGGDSNASSWFGWVIGIGVLFLLVLLFGFYKVNAPEKAVVTRFGAFHRIENPGLHWLIPLVETRTIVNVEQISNFTLGSLMLTQDVNIIDFSINVQYRIRDPKAYLFNDAVPIESLKEATESTLRQMVGHLALHDALLIDQRFSETLPETPEGSKPVAKSIQEVLDETNIAKSIQAILDSYQCGIEIKEVAIKQPRVPEEVRAAYEDVIKALENLETKKNEARAYANQISAEVEGQVKRILEEARAYQQERILSAEGDMARFNLLLPEYRKAPEITKKRLYIETLERLYQNNQKIFVDLTGSEVVVLPLDRLLSGRSEVASAEGSDSNSTDSHQQNQNLSKLELESRMGSDSRNTQSNIQNSERNGLDVSTNYRQQRIRSRYPLGDE